MVDSEPSTEILTQDYPVVSKEDELVHSEKEHSGWFPEDMSRIVFNIFPVWTKQASSITWVRSKCNFYTEPNREESASTDRPAICILAHFLWELILMYIPLSLLWWQQWVEKVKVIQQDLKMIEIIDKNLCTSTPY